jgi:hypothetical protein
LVIPLVCRYQPHNQVEERMTFTLHWWYQPAVRTDRLQLFEEQCTLLYSSALVGHFLKVSKDLRLAALVHTHTHTASGNMSATNVNGPTPCDRTSTKIANMPATAQTLATERRPKSQKCRHARHDETQHLTCTTCTPNCWKQCKVPLHYTHWHPRGGNTPTKPSEATRNGTKDPEDEQD